jgi:hypothetical protein
LSKAKSAAHNPFHYTATKSSFTPLEVTTGQDKIYGHTAQLLWKKDHGKFVMPRAWKDLKGHVTIFFASRFFHESSRTPVANNGNNILLLTP